MHIWQILTLLDEASATVSLLVLNNSSYLLQQPPVLLFNFRFAFFVNLKKL